MKINQQEKKLLITGIPGMGKTTIGNYLQDKHDFVHVDMESKKNNYIGEICANRDVFIDKLFNLNGNLVVTWGFYPNEYQTNCVNLVKNKGFKLIWLDGDRNSAREKFRARDSQNNDEEFLNRQLNAFEEQLKRIEKSDVVNKINPKIVNTFSSKNQFKKLEDIVKEIINA